MSFASTAYEAGVAAHQAIDGNRARASVWRIALLVAGFQICSTFVTVFSAEKLNFLYKDRLSLSANAFAIFGVVAAGATYLRPLFGACSDFVPIFGTHRRSYFTLASILLTGAFLALALTKHYAYTLVLALVILTGAGTTIAGVVTDAISVRVGNATGQVQRLQTIQMLTPTLLMAAFGAYLSGYVTQHWTYRACFLAAAAASLALLPLMLLIDERPVTDPALAHKHSADADAERVREKQADRAATWDALRTELRLPGFWIIFVFILYIWLLPAQDTAQFYFEVDGLHFSKQLIGNLAAYSNGGFAAGNLLFGLFSPKLSMRAIVWSIVATGIACYAPFLLLHNAATAEFANLFNGLMWGFGLLGVMTLAARSCPLRAEAVVFGAMMAMTALGNNVSEFFGSAIYTHFSHGHHFAHGWSNMIISGMIYGASIALFIPFLPAWARSKQTLVEQTRERQALAA